MNHVSCKQQKRTSDLYQDPQELGGRHGHPESQPFGTMYIYTPTGGSWYIPLLYIYLESQGTLENWYKYLLLRDHVPFSKVLWRVQVCII